MAFAADKEKEETKRKVDIFNCSICLERFKRPRHLPCLHSFCEQCLDSYITSTVKPGSEARGFPCPLCRKLITPETPGSPAGEWSRSFPLNHLINSMMELSVYEENQAKPEASCHWCEKVGDKISAIVWCRECREALCSRCKTLHSGMKNFDHTFVPVGSVEPPDALQLDVDEPCPVHKGKMYEVYCTDHRVLCCSVCFATKHRKCEDVRSLEEIAKDFDKSQAEDLIANLSGKESRIKGIIEKFEQNSSDLKRSEQDILTIVSKSVVEAKQKLDQLEALFKKSFAITVEDNESKLRMCIELHKQFLTSVETERKMLQVLVEKGSPRQVFITMERIRRHLSEQLESLGNDLNGSVVTLRFEINKALAGISEIDSLGDVNVEMEKFDCLKEIKGNDTMQFPLSADAFSPRAVLLRHFQIQVKEESRIFAGDILPNNDVVLLYRRPWSSTTGLYVCDPTGNCRRNYPTCPGPPVDIKSASKDSSDEVFICHGKCISRHRLDSDFTQLQSTSCDVDDELYGLSVTDELFLVGTESRVYILSRTGSNLKLFSSNCSGGYVSYVNQVVVSRNSNRCYFQDESKTVVCTTANGDVIWTHKLPNPDNVRGLAVDWQDDVYVCCMFEKYVYQIKADGSESRVLFKDVQHEDFDPYVIGFHPDGRRFFIGNFNTTVSTFQLH